jgi:hypothetical protein
MVADSVAHSMAASDITLDDNLIDEKARVDGIRDCMNVQLQLIDSLKAKIVKGNLAR